MNRLFHYAVTGLFLFVMLASFYLIYLQSIDGILIDKPITFYVDTQHLKTDKTEYHKGDTIYIFFSFCRNRAFTTISQWKLVNETVIFFPEGHYLLKPECQKDKYVAIGDVPPYAIPGPHHLEGTTAIKLNPLNTIYVEYKTVDFTVI